MPNVESDNDPGSFTIIPAGLSNERAWYLYEQCDEDARDVTCSKPLTQTTKSKYIFGAYDNDDQMQRKGRGKHVNYFI